MPREENQAEELRQRREQMHENGREERPEAIPDCEVNHLQRSRRRRNQPNPMEDPRKKKLRSVKPEANVLV
jgi:hypothetical protein